MASCYVAAHSQTVSGCRLFQVKMCVPSAHPRRPARTFEEPMGFDYISGITKIRQPGIRRRAQRRRD